MYTLIETNALRFKTCIEMFGRLQGVSTRYDTLLRHRWQTRIDFLKNKLIKPKCPTLLIKCAALFFKILMSILVGAIWAFTLKHPVPI